LVWATPIALDRFENEVKAYEAKDREKMPARGGVLFTGSSTFTLWGADLEREFRAHQAINRAIGGSTMAEINHYTKRLVTRYRPRCVIVYCGTNDLASGQTPLQVRDEYLRFVEAVQKELPKVEIALVSPVVAPSRVEHAAAFRETNRLLKNLCDNENRCYFLDFSGLLLDEKGQPRAEFYGPDQLHMNPAGYARWAPLLHRFLETER
jgi:lysophospholipase L1-like esterase